MVSTATHASTLHDLSPTEATTFANALLSWYDQAARKLPWRVPAVPHGSASYDAYVQRLYLCLVSETMLQQTQVATVIGYFERWMTQLPSMQAAAEAPQEQVLKAWAGLGYYSRARRLQEACQYLQSKYVAHERAFPEEVADWIKHVAGVGPYTAGAVLSIACNLPRAIVDGNVQRVLARFLAVRGDTKTPKSAGSKLIWDRSADLVAQAGDRPGAFNQALMELGATVCTPVKPNCAGCPLRSTCRAYRQYTTLKSASPFFKKRKAAVLTSDVEDVEEVPEACRICPSEGFALPPTRDFIELHYPLKIAKKQQRLEQALVVLIKRDGQVYVERKKTGLLAGLFDFPTLLLAEEEEVDLADLKGVRVLGKTVHLFTHIRRQSTILSADAMDVLETLPGIRTICTDGRWVSPEELEMQGVSELCLKSWRISTGEKKRIKKS